MNLFAYIGDEEDKLASAFSAGVKSNSLALHSHASAPIKQTETGNESASPTLEKSTFEKRNGSNSTEGSS